MCYGETKVAEVKPEKLSKLLLETLVISTQVNVINIVSDEREIAKFSKLFKPHKLQANNDEVLNVGHEVSEFQLFENVHSCHTFND